MVYGHFSGCYEEKRRELPDSGVAEKQVVSAKRFDPAANQARLRDRSNWTEV